MADTKEKEQPKHQEVSLEEDDVFEEFETEGTPQLAVLSLKSHALACLLL